MNLHWTRSTASGLGDRLLDLALMAAYARIDGSDLYLNWEPWIPGAWDVPHRSQDVLWKNVEAHLVLPARIFVNQAPTPPKRLFDRYLGGGISVEDFHRGHVGDACPLLRFEELYCLVLKEFSFCPEILAHLKVLPDRFTAYHIRRGDAIRTASFDSFRQLHRSALPALTRATFAALEHDFKTADAFYLCGDQDEFTEEFRQFVLVAGKTVVMPPPVEKWKSTYYDLAIMSRAERVVVAHNASSFSEFAALIGGKPRVSIFNYHGITL